MSLSERFAALLHQTLPRTLLVRTFLLVSLLIFSSVAIWLTLFSLAEREPRARQLAQLTVSIVNITNAALVAADPIKRVELLRDLAESEGIHLYPAEATDQIKALPDTYFFRVMLDTARSQLGIDTRFAGSVNGETGIWVSFSIDDTGDDNYWLMVPGEHADSDLPLRWLGWGAASLALALLVAWLIASRITDPLRSFAFLAAEVGGGKHPAPIPERGALELRKLAEAFNRMSNDLKRIEIERAEVLAGLSHDLRTPLTRLRLESEMSISDEEARRSSIEDIEQMDAIIAQFLDYARDERIEQKTPCDVNEMITQIAVAQARTLPPLQLELGELPLQQIHCQALKRAIINLIDNARKYGSLEITVKTRCAQDEVLLEVRDHGPGIPPAEIERLKRPFTRLENARSNTNGTGLGLAIVERIARLHSGQLELINHEGGGLIARLRLPLQS